MRILLVDDDPLVANRLRLDLEADGHEVAIAHSKAQAFELMKSGPFQLCILDEVLSCRSGSGVCRALLDSGTAPYIMMISSIGDVVNRVDCLLCGADDYLPKPFAPEELVARVKAAHRRIEHGLSYGDLRLDLFRRAVERNGEAIPLTNREFDLLSYFMNHPDCVLHRDRLAADVWNIPFETGTNIIDVYVTYLRRKLARVGANLIHSVRGQGYRFGA